MDFSDEEEQIQGKSRSNRNITLETKSSDIDGLLSKLGGRKCQLVGVAVHEEGWKSVFDEVNKEICVSKFQGKRKFKACPYQRLA